jgi:hypothetical protein
MNYHRVIPRDLFNEAKLLKCIGLLCVNILDKMTPIQMDFYNTGDPFDIQFDMNNVELYISNIRIRIKGNDFLFVTNYNSKDNYPLYIVDNSDNRISVFDENGNWDIDFEIFCLKINQQPLPKV